jgi:transposase
MMNDLFLLSGRQMVDDRRVVSGIVYFIKNGLQWKDAPAGYGPPPTRRSTTDEGPKPEHIMIDVTCSPEMSSL